MRYLYTLGAAALLLSAATSGSALAQENGTPGATQREFSKIGAGTGMFLDIPVGARAMGMGASFAGVADDPSALYWNTAGIMQVEGASASYSFAPMFADIGHHYAAVAFPVGDGYKAGISAISYGTGGIEQTDMFNQEGTGATYSVRDLALGVSFAGQLTEQFAFGASAKYISMQMAGVTGNGIAFDVGTLYKPGLLGMRIGFAVQNLSSTVQFEGSDLITAGQIDPISGNQEADAEAQSGDASLPLIFRAGISSNVLEGDEMNALLVSTEFSTANSRPEKIGVGVEYTWNNLLSARAGYQFGSPDAYGISGGIGLKYLTGSFDGAIDAGVRPHQTLGLVYEVTASVRLQ